MFSNIPCQPGQRKCRRRGLRFIVLFREALNVYPFVSSLKSRHISRLSVGLVWGFSPDPPVQQSGLSENVIKSRDQGDWNLAPHAHFSNDLRKVLRCQSHSSLRKLWEHFLSSHVTRSVHWWSLFKAHESLLVYQFLAFIKLGPFCTSEKGFYLEKFPVIINILQVQLDCCDLTNFGRSGQIFKRIAVVSFKNCTPNRNMPPAAGNGYSLRRHNTFLTYVPS